MPTGVAEPISARASMVDPTVVTTAENDGPGSLREVVFFAPSGSTITFDPNLAGQTIVLTGPINVLQSVTIQGPTTQGITISGGGAGQVFSTSTGTLWLRNLTITGGDAATDPGHGSAIFNGGAHLIVEASTISGNQGAGIMLFAGSLVLDNSTVSGNGGPGVHASGGDGITLRFVTITDNAEGLERSVPAVFRSIIVAENDRDCDTAPGAPAPDLQGTNIDGDGSCGLAPTLDFPNTDPELEPLADNGGPTKTHALRLGSPAIDAASCLFSQDQRGIARPQGASCDIGAYERMPINVSLTIDPSATVNPGTGAATVTGSLTCSLPLDVELSVEVTQMQKVRRVPVARTGSATTVVPCTGSGTWSLVVPPPAGFAFVNGEATVVADAVNSDNAGTATGTVRLFWARK
jgi:hypothetical protein